VPSIETDVKGQPGTCERPRPGSARSHKPAHDAATAGGTPIGVRTAGLVRPAATRSAARSTAVDGDTRPVGDTEAARALDISADSIDAVAQQMAHAREIAQAGGLP